MSEISPLLEYTYINRHSGPPDKTIGGVAIIEGLSNKQ